MKTVRQVDALYVDQWKFVHGYVGRYEVSTSGQFRAWFSQNGRGKYLDTPRPVKTTPNHNGYHVLTLRSADGVKKQHRAHCLVLETFVGPRPDGCQGAHHNDDKNDNRLVNLAWKTVGENTRDRSINGKTAKGERHGSYKHGNNVGTNRIYYPPKYVADL